MAQVAKPTAYNDERFSIILSHARDIKGLARELHDMANHKFDELLGSPPPNPIGDDCKQADPSWVDRVIDEQDMTMGVLRDTLERLSMV